MPLILTNKLFKSPSELIFECSGIIREVQIVINETEVHLDFHIFAILDFELLIGYRSEILFQEKSSHGSLNEEFGKIASATHSDNSKAEHHPNNDLFEEVKFVTRSFHHHPRSNLSNVPLAIQMSFSIVVYIQPMYFLRTKASMPWTFCLVPHASMRTITLSQPLFATFLRGWL